MELVEDGVEVVMQLVPEIDVRFDDGQVAGAVGPRFVIARIGVLDVASSSAVLSCHQSYIKNFGRGY